MSSQDKVKINFASEKDLQKLHGVGPSVAKAISQYRSSVGNISPTSLNEIKNLKVTSEFLDNVDFTKNGDLFDNDQKNGVVSGTSNAQDDQMINFIQDVGNMVQQKNQMADTMFHNSDDGKGADANVGMTQQFQAFSPQKSPSATVNINQLNLTDPNDPNQGAHGQVGLGDQSSSPPGQVTPDIKPIQQGQNAPIVSTTVNGGPLGLSTQGDPQLVTSTNVPTNVTSTNVRNSPLGAIPKSTAGSMGGTSNQPPGM